MRGSTNFGRVLNVAMLAAAVSAFSACGGSGENGNAVSVPQALTNGGPDLQGRRVSGRSEALQIVARGIIAPLVFSEQAHATLASSFKSRASSSGSALATSAGDTWVVDAGGQAAGTHSGLEGPILVRVDAADNAEGLLLRDEVGSLRATLHFAHSADDAASGTAGTITLDVSRSAAGAGTLRRSQSDAVSTSDGNRKLNWSYLLVEVEAQQQLRKLNVVSDVPIDGSDRVSLDTTFSNPAELPVMPAGAIRYSGQYVATGVISSLNAGLTLQIADDGAWAIDIDNDKGGRVDFAVKATSLEAQSISADSI
jgi:hypothetical protein